MRNMLLVSAAFIPTIVYAGTELPVPNYGAYTYTAMDRLADDHWTETNLNTTLWYSGIWVSYQGSGGYDEGCSGCNPQSTIDSSQWPTSLWGVAANSNGATSNDYNFMYNYPYDSNVPSGVTTYAPLWVTAEGNLRFRVIQNSYWTPDNPYALYIGSAITLKSPYAIPAAGGMLQFSLRGDTNLQHGSWPGVQCSSVQGTGYNTNFNMEWGYTEGGADSLGLVMMGFSFNNATVNTFSLPTTNNAENYHTYAMEYTGDSPASHTVNFYVDGIKEGSKVVPTTQSGLSYQCSFYGQLIANSNLTGGSSPAFHSQTNISMYPGPMDMFVGDVQVYKAP